VYVIGLLKDILTYFIISESSSGMQILSLVLSMHSQFTTDNHILPDMQPPSANSTGLSSIIFKPSLASCIIRKLNAHSAGGPDGVPPSFLKKHARLL